LGVALILGAVPIFGLAQFGSSLFAAAPTAVDSDEQTALVSFSPLTFDAPTATKTSLQESAKNIEYAARREVATEQDDAVTLADWTYTARRGRRVGTTGTGVNAGDFLSAFLLFQQQTMLFEQQLLALILQLEQQILVLEQEINNARNHRHSHHR
jgi:hypothetical protein